jgi:hypothetical protein
MSDSGLRLRLSQSEVPRVMSDSGLRLRLRPMVPGIAIIIPKQTDIKPHPLLLQIVIPKPASLPQTQWL